MPPGTPERLVTERKLRSLVNVPLADPSGFRTVWQRRRKPDSQAARPLTAEGIRVVQGDPDDVASLKPARSG